MSTGTLPEDLANKVMESFGDDAAPLILLSKANRRWAQLSRPYLLSNLAFKNEQDIVDFSVLLQAEHCTFPPSIRCKELALRNATSIGDETFTSVREFLASITVENSLQIRVTDGRIPNPVVQASIAWNSITQLTLSGEGYNPPAVFYYLSSFTGLESVRLEDFSFMVAEQGTDPTIQFSLPSTVTRLATIRSSSAWTFFHQHIIPGGGLSSICHLRIEALFYFEEPGVWDMVPYLWTVQGVETLELSSLYDANILGLDLKLVNRPGLQRLELDFSRVPAQIALDTLTFHATYLPIAASDVNINIDIHLPESPALWDQSDPDKQLRQYLGKTSPLGTPPTISPRTLTLKGFPSIFPDTAQADGSTRVCGYPVSIVETVKSQAREEYKPGGYLHGPVFRYWKYLKDAVTEWLRIRNMIKQDWYLVVHHPHPPHCPPPSFTFTPVAFKIKCVVGVTTGAYSADFRPNGERRVASG
ncbi:hypothetical protein FA13DRAFT_1703803 [Coprinellus micaceus]|uniref:Uncharacterized protein n=1 Tax=Coprinellus micaceus TaxID=71717 RepID=A0A4Y7TZ97_COPMI|nr:hypothetical protein FA13DRAFT_1703803 [Coprinellus micaceus]